MDEKWLETYKRDLWSFLEHIKPGQKFKVIDQCEKVKPEIFIEVVKEYMRSLPYQGCIMFNHDFTVFYKTGPLPDNAYELLKINEQEKQTTCNAKSEKVKCSHRI